MINERKFRKRVAVVMGGWSGEREVSLSSANGVMQALRAQNYEVYSLDFTQNIKLFLETLLNINPDVVFMNAMHGRWGEDGCLQGLLEMLGIPYTNSGVLSSAAAMDKSFARKIFAAEGLPIPFGMIIPFTQAIVGGVLPTPYVIKPLQEGSSLGVYIIKDEAQLNDVKLTWSYGERVIVEKYIPGREIQVAILGNHAWGAIEICPKEGFYDYQAKYTEGKTDHLMPAPLAPEIYKEALDLALKAHQCLGCEGVSRVDLRYDNTQKDPGQFYLLEVNTQPGLTPLSLVPEIVAHQGMSYDNLVEWMVENPHYPYRSTPNIEVTSHQAQG